MIQKSWKRLLSGIGVLFIVVGITEFFWKAIITDKEVTNKLTFIATGFGIVILGFFCQRVARKTVG